MTTTLSAPTRPIPRPAPEREMPFRPENVMTTLLLAAIGLLVALGVFGAIAISIWGGSNSTPTVVYVIGLVLLALKVLLAMLQAEVSRRALDRKLSEVANRAEDARHDIKAEVHETKAVVAELAERTDGGLKAAVREVGEQVRAAERDQALTAVMSHPGFRELLEEVAGAAVKRFCADRPGG